MLSWTREVNKLGTSPSNRNVRVTIEELVRGVNIALQRSELEQCVPFDADGNDQVSVNELVQGVRNLLQGCPD